YQPLEHRYVEIVAIELGLVARLLADEFDPRLRILERLPQARDVDLQGPERIVGRGPGPQAIDHLVGGDDPSGAEQEQPEQRARLRTLEIDRSAGRRDKLDRPQDPITHAAPTDPVPASDRKSVV